MNKGIYKNIKAWLSRWLPLNVALVLLVVLAIMPTFWQGREGTAAAVIEGGQDDTHNTGSSSEAPWEELKLHLIVPEEDIIKILDPATGVIGSSTTTGTNDFSIGARRNPEGSPEGSWKIFYNWLDGSEIVKIIEPIAGITDRELLGGALDQEWALRMKIPDEVVEELKKGYKVGVTATDAKEENLKGGTNAEKVREIIDDKKGSIEGIPSNARRAREFIRENKEYGITLGDLGSPEEKHTIDQLFEGDLQYKLEGEYLYIKVRPIIRFQEGFSYLNIIDGFEKNIPIVDSAYGGNSHVIVGPGTALGERSATTVVYDLDLFTDENPDPEKLKADLERVKGPGYLHFTQILNAQGELHVSMNGKEDGKYWFLAWGDGLGIPYKSDEGARIGSNTPNSEYYFKGGGAIGLWWWYPLELTFYRLPMEDVAVTGIEFGDLEPESDVDVTVMVYRAPNKSADNDADDVDEDKELDTTVVFSVNGGESKSKNVTLHYDETQPVDFSFTAPARGVIKMTAEINPEKANGKRDFEEVTYENNILTVVAMVGDYGDLYPWVYSRDIEFSLPTAKAELSKPSYAWWEGDASGTLKVHNNSTNIYRVNEFTADGKTGNPTIIPDLVGGSGRILHSAHITATLHREDFEDDPANLRRLPSGSYYADNFEDLTKTGLIGTDGPAEQKYAYLCEHEDYSHVVTSIAHSEFSNVNYDKDYHAYVYNGMKELPDQKDFKKHFKKTEKKTTTEFPFDLAWEGTHYRLDRIEPGDRPGLNVELIRWMCHINADGSEDWYTKLYKTPGRYKRTFIGQSIGTITWEIVEKMADIYYGDRERARGRATGKGNYDYAVFATDKLLQNYAYPIKSGYYFNPVGTYKCTLYTKQYKNTNNSTTEHADLVKKIREAFYYDSSLVYVNRDQRAGILGQITEKDGRTRGGLLDIKETSYSLDWEKLDTTLNLDNTDDALSIHKLLKEVLEGYKESNTYDDSYLKYKYREQTNKEIYEVEETTEITFTLRVPNGQKLYTHVNMKNGDYAVMARVRKIEFEFDDYLGIDIDSPHNSILGMSDEFINLDGIKVTVSGSMYDDRK